MIKQHCNTIAYAKTKLTQQERIETVLKRGNYRRNKVLGLICKSLKEQGLWVKKPRG